MAVFTLQLGLDCTRCKAAQLASAPLVAVIPSFGGVKVQGSNAIVDRLRRSRFSPVQVDGEIIVPPGGVAPAVYSGGTVTPGRAAVLMVSRIVKASAPVLAAPTVEAARPAPAFRAAIERPVMSVRAASAREIAVDQLMAPRRGQPAPPAAQPSLSIQRRPEPPAEGPLTPTESAALLSHLRGVVGR